MTEFQEAMRDYRREEDQAAETQKQKYAKQAKAREHEAEIGNLQKAVTTAKAELEAAQRVYAETLKGKDYETLKAAMEKQTAAEARLSVAQRTLTPIIDKLEEEAERIPVHMPRLPYQAAARELMQTVPEISLFLFILRKYLRQTIGNPEKVAPRDQIERRLEAGLTDEEAARLFEEWITKAA